MKTNIFLFALINTGVYILLLLVFKYMNLLHIWGLYMVNYLTLSLISIWQIHRWIRQNNGYIPFLEAFFTVFFTGTLSFALFSAFIFLYSFLDPYLTQLFITHVTGTGHLVPAIVLFFEGSGGSIIVGLVASFYAARYEDGETQP